MPSVRGPQRTLVAAVLVASGTLSGAFVGLVTAMAAGIAPDPSRGFVLAVVAIGVALDALALIVGRPLPPGSGRQVPQEWGRLLSPPVVAALYGARLGVGPLTILSTWTWWSVTLAAALIGPLSAVAVGAVFGAVRLLVTVTVSLVSSRPKVEAAGDLEIVTPVHAEWFGALRTRQRPNWFAINALGIVAVSAVAIAGCSGGTSDAAPAISTDSETPTTINDPTINDPSLDDADETNIWMLEPESSPGPASTTDADDAVTASDTSATGLTAIYPAELEDFVRTATPLTNDPTDPTIAVDPTTDPASGALATLDLSSEPDALAEVLTAEIDGFQPVNEPLADRYLDIIAASELQPDPTEEISLLETRGFEGGWTRAFRNDHNDVAVASVYHFDDPAEAEFYLEDGLITIGGYGGKFFDIDGLPGVRGFVQHFTETDENGTEELVSLGAAFQSGPRWYLVYFVGSTETVTPELLIPAITAQRQAA